MSYIDRDDFNELTRGPDLTTLEWVGAVALATLGIACLLGLAVLIG